jgi:hypothetical protein
MSKSNSQVTLAVIQNDISYIKQEVHDIKVMVQEQYVTKAEFEPIKKIVYGLVSIILIAVVGAIVSLVISKP